MVGPNAIRSHGTHPAAVLLRQFDNALLLLLGAATITAFFFGEHTDALVITVIIALSVSLGFFNQYRSERALAELYARIRYQAVVVRSGQLKSVDVTELVRHSSAADRGRNRCPKIANPRRSHGHHLRCRRVTGGAVRFLT